MFGIIWQCLFAFQARATVLLDSDAIWGEKRIPTFFFFFSEKVPQQLQHEWRDMREFSLFFCSASDPVWSPPITLTLLDYIFNDNLNRGVTFLAFFIFLRGQASVRQSLRAQCQKNMRVVSTSVKRDRMCEKAGTLENVRVKRRTNWFWL